MIEVFGTAPVYVGHVTNYQKHLSSLRPFIEDEEFWHKVKLWDSKTCSTFGHEKNEYLPWDEIIKDVEYHLGEYLKTFKPFDAAALAYYIEYWANKYEKGAWQESHNHAGRDNHFSVAYILDAQDQENFVFSEIGGTWYNQITELGNYFKEWPSRYWTPPQKNGTILIFPSSLEHYVKPNQSDNLRISISANFSLFDIKERK